LVLRDPAVPLLLSSLYLPSVPAVRQDPLVRWGRLHLYPLLGPVARWAPRAQLALRDLADQLLLARQCPLLVLPDRLDLAVQWVRRALPVRSVLQDPLPQCRLLALWVRPVLQARWTQLDLLDRLLLYRLSAPAAPPGQLAQPALQDLRLLCPLSGLRVRPVRRAPLVQRAPAALLLPLPLCLPLNQQDLPVQLHPLALAVPPAPLDLQALLAPWRQCPLLGLVARPVPEPPLNPWCCRPSCPGYRRSGCH
jgi:hypothetical protein